MVDGFDPDSPRGWAVPLGPARYPTRRITDPNRTAGYESPVRAWTDLSSSLGTLVTQLGDKAGLSRSTIKNIHELHPSRVNLFSLLSEQLVP